MTGKETKYNRCDVASIRIFKRRDVKERRQKKSKEEVGKVDRKKEKRKERGLSPIMRVEFQVTKLRPRRSSASIEQRLRRRGWASTRRLTSHQR